MIRPCCAAALLALTGVAMTATCKCGRVVVTVPRADGKRDMRRDVAKAVKL